MKYIGALVLTIVTGGAIDFMPEAHRPWVVDFRNPNRYPSRGRTLAEAWRGYFKNKL